MASPYLCLLLLACFLPIFSSSKLINGKCLHDQRSYLLQFRDGVQINQTISKKVAKWNRSADCCVWDGVACDGLGHVISLELDDESIRPINENWKNLFHLQYLEDLNLAGNHFGRVNIPAELQNLTRLKHLDLSDSGFGGEIPHGLSKMIGLSTLDLSSNYDASVSLKLFQNLTELKEVHLDGVQISALGSDDCNAFSHLSKLQVLSLSYCYLRLSCPLLPSLSNLTSLTTIRLDSNTLNSIVPNSFANFTTLSILSLSQCELHGPFPEKIFQIPTLEILDVRLNQLLSGRIPQLVQYGSLSEISLGSTNFSGSLPDSIGFLRELSYLDLSYCHFHGKVPATLANLSKLEQIDVSYNSLSGKFPSYLFTFQSLQSLDLSNNRITGGIPDFLCNQTFLEVLDLSNNFLRGTIPDCLLARQNFGGVVVLSGNKLSGHIPDTFNDSSCGLHVLDLSQNNLTGELPKSLTNCEYVQVINVGNNNLKGHFPCTLTKRQYLRIIILRANGFDGELNCSNWDDNSWPSLQMLDISHNHFSGALPSRLFSNCGEMMMDDKSNAPPLHYMFTLFYNGDKLEYIDNVWLVIKGTKVKLVKILSIYKTLDFSSNHFQGSIPKEIGGLRGLYTLNLSHNALTGTIPGSIGGLSQLESLDLSVNQLTGRIPSELGNLTFLSDLNLSYNQLTGRIPDCRQPLSESSFFGNKGLCGFPLSSCERGSSSPSSLAAGHRDKEEIDWEYVSAALGFSVGLGLILLFNFLNPTWWQRFNALILRFLIIRVFGIHVQ